MSLTQRPVRAALTFTLIVRALDQAYRLLSPIADMIAMRYGAVVSIMMATPQGDDGEVRPVT